MNMNDAIDTVLDSAKKKGLALDVLGVQRKSTAIAFQDRKLDTFSFSETCQLGVRVLDGRHEGLAYTESLERDSLEAMVNDAAANARMIQKEIASDLAGPVRLPSIDKIYDPSLEQVAIEDKIQAAALLEAGALDFDKRITGLAYTRYGDGTAEVWVANTLGLRGSYKTASVSAYSYCLAKDKDANVMDGELRMARRFQDLNTLDIARTAAENTLMRLGSVRPKTGHATVVFENQVAEELIGLITDYFSAKEVDQQTSPLAGRLGQTLFSQHLTLIDDPFLAAATGCRPFDEEGYASHTTPLVEDGRLVNFLTNSVYAKKMKLPHTASAARSPATELEVSTSNVVVKPGSQSFAQLLSADKKVILITSFKGTAGFRSASGDFSIPVEGVLYENGQRVVALKDFLISGNVLELLGSVEAVANDAKSPTGSIVCPSLLVRDVNISGQA